MLDTNIEVHFFRGDPGKFHDKWMYSIRDSRGYRRGVTGGKNLFIAALLVAKDIMGDAYREAMDEFWRHYP